MKIPLNLCFCVSLALVFSLVVPGKIPAQVDYPDSLAAAGIDSFLSPDFFLSFSAGAAAWAGTTQVNTPTVTNTIRPTFDRLRSMGIPPWRYLAAKAPLRPAITV